MLVAGVLLIICAGVTFLTGKFHMAFVMYFCVSFIAVVIMIITIGIPLLRRRIIFPCVNLWTPRHVIG